MYIHMKRYLSEKVDVSFARDLSNRGIAACRHILVPRPKGDPLALFCWGRDPTLEFR